MSLTSDNSVIRSVRRIEKQHVAAANIAWLTVAFDQHFEARIQNRVAISNIRLLRLLLSLSRAARPELWEGVG